jgi:glycosyltransferase involved in cell wall biosynthesis
MNIKYSFIIPHFEDYERLKTLLNSLPLTKTNVQILVVDDCSSNQKELCNLRSLFPSIEWLTTSKHAGAGAARNIGIVNAVGKYLIFADSDDYFLPDVIDVFDVHLSDTDELVYFLSEAVQEANGMKSLRSDFYNDLCLRYYENPSHENRVELCIRHVVPWSKVYSTSFIKGIGIFFEEIMFSNDVMFNVKASLEANSIRVVTLPIYKVIRRSQSLTTTNTSQGFLERLRCSARLADYLHMKGIKKVISCNGAILSSVYFGPRVMLTVLKICYSSRMRIKVTKLFDLHSWVLFFKTRGEINNCKTVIPPQNNRD